MGRGHSIEAIIDAALKYKHRVDFEKNERGKYKAALRLGIIDRVCSHMVSPPIHNKKWEYASIKDALQLCKTKQEFREKYAGAYSAAHKLKITKELFKDLPKRTASNKKWHKDNIIDAMKNCEFRTEFQKKYSGAYDAAQSQGFLEDYYKEIGLKSHGGYSIAEQELFKYVHSFHSDAVKMRIKSDTENAHPNCHIEIDVFIPSLSLGIEYCGVYWHSDLYHGKDDHQEKMKICNKSGIRLITVFEDEWIERRSQVKNFLMSAMKVSEIKVFARKCQIRDIPMEDARRFLNENHIQGAASYIFNQALIYKDEVVALMTFGRHHRKSNKTCIVLNRLCFKSGVTVVGGASRLFKALSIIARKNDYLSVISWSDNRWSEGDVYKQLGFTLDHESGPDYSYVYGSSRFSKQSLKKNSRQDDMSKTEYELRKEQGYNRIWDCGKKRWIFLLTLC